MEYIFLWLSSPYVAWQDALKAWPMGFQDPATPVMQGIIDLHDYICFFLIVILSSVLWMLIRRLYFFHESQNPIPEKIIHGTSIEIAWTVAPSLILLFMALPFLGLMALPSFALLYTMDQVVDLANIPFGILELMATLFFLLLMAISMRGPNQRPPLKIYVIARKYFWGYYWQYIVVDDLGPMHYMRMVQSRQLENNPRYVDNELVIPYDRRIIFIVISLDGVRCRWTLPALRINMLASPNDYDYDHDYHYHYHYDIRMITIPGPSVYCGASSSEAGYLHPTDRSVDMPVVVRAVPPSDFDHWFREEE